MPIALDRTPKTKRSAGERCCEPIAYSNVDHQQAAPRRKALGDPVRLQRVDVLREAGIVRSERQGLWASYHVIPDALNELLAWVA